MKDSLFEQDKVVRLPQNKINLLVNRAHTNTVTSMDTEQRETPDAADVWKWSREDDDPPSCRRSCGTSTAMAVFRLNTEQFSTFT